MGLEPRDEDPARAESLPASPAGEGEAPDPPAPVDPLEALVDPPPVGTAAGVLAFALGRVSAPAADLGAEPDEVFADPPALPDVADWVGAAADAAVADGTGFAVGAATTTGAGVGAGVATGAGVGVAIGVGVGVDFFP